jgi:hypothetical protein
MTRCMPGIVPFFLVLGLTTIAQAVHPFHVCIAQMQWNAQQRCWEVSLRLHPQDLERALAREKGGPVSIDDRDFQEKAIPFLSKHFSILHAPDSISNKDLLTAIERDEKSFPQSELRWIGMEPERGWLWIHLELTPPSDRSASGSSGNTAWLIHSIFLDTIDRQENSVRIIHGTERYALQFQRGNEAQRLKTKPDA